MRRSSITLARARLLRKNNTDAERRLWRCLRSFQLSDFKFRRQHVVGPFIVDLACLERMLIVELDGGQHANAAAADAARTYFLEARGFRVMRVWNNDVLENADAVLEHILRALSLPLTPALSPDGERE